MYAALGIHNCLPHSHGSQGCCAYHRSTLTRHYKEPVMAATSSFTEGSSVFGGQANLLQAIQNIFTVYDPDVIAVHTTCLSETIGDDIPQIIAKARDEKKIPEGKYVIHANTPSYVGSHVTGFANMVKAMVDYFAEPAADQDGGDQPHPRLGRALRHARDQAPGRGWGSRRSSSPTRPTCWTPRRPASTCSTPKAARPSTPCGHRRQPGDLRPGPHRLRAGGRGSWTPSARSPAHAGAAHRPAGHRPLHRRAAQSWPASRSPPRSTEERGRLVDMITDMHQYFYGKRVALWGDPDQLVALAEFLADLDMRPVYIVTGTPGKQLRGRDARRPWGRVPEAKVSQGAGADMFLMHQWIKQEPVDLLIGNTYGKYIARDEDIPFVRHGFPILDRVGHSVLPHGRLPAAACGCWRRSSMRCWTTRTGTPRRKLRAGDVM